MAGLLDIETLLIAGVLFCRGRLARLPWIVVCFFEGVLMVLWMRS